MMICSADSVFHVHSYRCGHAQTVPDDMYVKRAISLNARSIWFSDHSPFPGDPFGNRMNMSELDEYLTTLLQLKREYAGRIEIHIGLEIEYFPSYDMAGYYKDLCDDKRIEFLMLGQHMAETGINEYTFSWDKTRLFDEEYRALGEAIVTGIESGYFNYVAHPDRIFRRKKSWDESMSKMSLRIINAASKSNIPLEINMHSVATKYHYWKEFWKLVPDETLVFTGLDVHSLDELTRRYLRQQRYITELTGRNTL